MFFAVDLLVLLLTTRFMVYVTAWRTLGTMELTGLSIFIVALLGYLRNAVGELRIVVV